MSSTALNLLTPKIDVKRTRGYEGPTLGPLRESQLPGVSAGEGFPPETAVTEPGAGLPHAVSTKALLSAQQFGGAMYRTMDAKGKPEAATGRMQPSKSCR